VGNTPLVQAQTPVNPELEQQVLEIIRKNPAVILESVAAYQRQQQENRLQTQKSVLQELQNNPKAIIGQSPTLGEGRVILIQFSDFQCPFCAQSYDIVRQFLARRAEWVTLVHKHLPLSQIHPQAMAAAKAAWAAQQQGKFWPFSDELILNQKDLGEPLYQKTAQKLGLDLKRFDRDRESPEATAAIEEDIKLAEQLGADGTPFFVMNGEAFSGLVSVEELERRFREAYNQNP
jgi:protein-disulfide isomerase